MEYTDIRIKICPPTLRTWMQNIASCIRKQYTGEEKYSKPKTMWKEKPDHWPLNKPFYDTKNKSQNDQGKSISDEDLLKSLLDCCKHKNEQINYLYQKEVDAWQEKRLGLLYKLYIFRINMEKIKMAIKIMISYKDSEEMKTGLQSINVSLTSETDITRSWCKGQSEIITEITRKLATILCKIIKGKDPEAKSDGIWKSPPENWPSAVPFYSPHNRGKCKQTGSDKELVLTLIQNPKAIIPQKYQSLVTAFQNIVNANNSREAKKHKETLCRIYTIQNNTSIIDNALKTMHEHGLFTLNIHSILNQWWTKQSFDPQSDYFLKNSAIISNKRQAIQIHITETSFKIGFQPNDLKDNTKSLVFYNITSQTQKSTSQTICCSSSCSKHSHFEHCKDQEIFTKEQSKNCKTQESRHHLSENRGISKDELVTAIENDVTSLNSKQIRGKKRKHPQDEELLFGIKRPTLSADKTYNTQTENISEMQQSEQPSIRSQENIELQDSEKWLFANLGITDDDLSTFLQEVNLNILSSDDDCFSDQLEVLPTDMVGYESGKNSNTEELLSRGHDKE
ncbi:uncharacterized protein LOC127708837 isoform X3 [Mytilus californianus]|uniref:uncharacterized protein LOC127708837 isoform X3 n=1 Tax=Mytilus californianus TaxID=6549 RepID=UPI002246238F|nr:uncharacterized protein LOC127708837 isoform X3 [Mytilus californianus]